MGWCPMSLQFIGHFRSPSTQAGKGVEAHRQTIYRILMGTLRNDRTIAADGRHHLAFGRFSERLLDFRCRDLPTPFGGEAAKPDMRVLTSYVGNGFGFFISDSAAAPAIESEIEAMREVLIVTVITGETREQPQTQNSRISAQGSCIKIAYVPAHTAVESLICEEGFRTVTLVLDPAVFPQNLDLSLPDLPYAIQALMGSANGAVASHPISSTVQRVAEEALDYIPRPGHLGGLFYRMKALQLFWEIVERFSTEDNVFTRAQVPNEKELCSVERVKALLQENPAGEFPIERLGRLAAMNRTKLRSIFKETYGQTISQFRTEVRMKRAHELLHETDLSVAEIGFDLGYADASSFIVAFKKFFGFNPGWVRSGQRTSDRARRPHRGFEVIAEHARPGSLAQSGLC
jgi:AraC-like DNA-binding protein